MAKGKLKIVGHSEWRDVVYTPQDGEVIITEPPGVVILMADRAVHVQLEDGTIRHGCADKSGKIIFTRGTGPSTQI